eukprot:98473-Hanusia_phi.AAC.1
MARGHSYSSWQQQVGFLRHIDLTCTVASGLVSRCSEQSHPGYRCLSMRSPPLVAFCPASASSSCLSSTSVVWISESRTPIALML